MSTNMKSRSFAFVNPFFWVADNLLFQIHETMLIPVDGQICCTIFFYPSVAAHNFINSDVITTQPGCYSIGP